MKLVEVVLKRVDLKGLLIEDLLVGVVEAKLKELAAKSDNSLDDALLAMIMPELKKSVSELVDSELAKLSAE